MKTRSVTPVTHRKDMEMIKRVLSFSLFFIAAATIHSTFACAAGMQKDVNQAVAIIERFRRLPEKSIPPAVLRHARGLAIMTVVKAGFIFSGRGGTGVVVARTRRGWSGPSAIGTGGAGFGLQIGAQVTEFVFVLNTPDAVRAFSEGGNIALGADLSVAAGPVGRTVEAGVTPYAAVYSYSISQGLFGGISLEGTVIATRNKVNEQYYGRYVTPDEILSGSVRVPAGARRLQRVLARY